MTFKESKFWPIENAINYLDAAFHSINRTCTNGLMKGHEKRDQALEIAGQVYLLEEQLKSLLRDIKSSEQKKKEKE